MAIDFSGYASNYAGGGSPGGTGSVESNAGGVLGTSLGLGIGAIPNFQERYQNYRKKDITKSTNPYLQAAMGMDSDGKAMDISDFNLLDADGNSTYKDAVRSFVDYKGALEAGTGGKGARFGKKSERKGLVNVKDYINSYNQEMSFVAPMVGEKIMAYARDNFKTDDDMKEWIRERGLGQFIHDNFKQDPNNPNPMNAKLKEWATPDETSRQWASRHGYIGGKDSIPGSGALNVGLDVATPITAGTLAYQTGKPLYEGVTRLFGKGPSYTPSQLSKLADNMKGKIGTKADAKTLKKLTPAKGNLSKAKNILQKAQENYKGKSFKSTTKGPKSYKALNNKVKVAEKAFNKANSKAGKGSLSVINKYIKKHGTSNLIKVLGKKYGWAGGLRLAGKLGLGTVLSGTGIGTAAGIGLNLYALWEVANLISDLAD